MSYAICRAQVGEWPTDKWMSLVLGRRMPKLARRLSHVTNKGCAILYSLLVLATDTRWCNPGESELYVVYLDMQILLSWVWQKWEICLPTPTCLCSSLPQVNASYYIIINVMCLLLLTAAWGWRWHGLSSLENRESACEQPNELVPLTPASFASLWTDINGGLCYRAYGWLLCIYLLRIYFPVIPSSNHLYTTWRALFHNALSVIPENELAVPMPNSNIVFL